MIRNTLAIGLMVFVFAGCAKKEKQATTETASSAAATQTSATSTTATASAADSGQQATSLVSFPAGALLVQSPPEYGGGWSAAAMIDTYPDHGYATPQNDITPKTFVIALPEKTLLDRLEFDTGNADGSKRGAKDIEVEVSDTSATDGFQKIAGVSLEDQKDSQSFPVQTKVPGRWVRVTLKNNQGAPDYIELLDFRGYGRQLTSTPFTDVSGTYESSYGNFHLKQEGTSVTGCYEHDGGLLTGGIDGRVMNFTWREEGGTDTDEGPAMMVFTSDAKQMLGVWANKGEKELTNTWDGKKISNDVGSCPNWSPKGGAEARMEDELSKFGRTRVYGINFDTDSDVIRAESKPTLDKVAAVLKSQAAWTMTIEGHTDSSGGDAHNQELSQKRAESVKNYLVTAGVDAARLTAKGMGAGTPVAPNETAMGRAQNRRVELVKG